MTRHNSKLVQLVDRLNDGEFHDGTQLGDELQITRSAVWKMIKKLQNYGIAVESVKGKGYWLKEQLVLLRGNDIFLFESLPSTNLFLKNLRSKELTFCLTEQQTAGKGRLGREWYSPFGKNIYFSCLYPIQKDISELAGLSLVVSLAIIKTLQIYIKDNKLKVKWPNDVLYDGAKLAGVLIELQAESHGACQAIIGIGMNVNMLADDSQISQAWTSLQKITGNYIDRNALYKNLIENLLNYLNRFVTESFSTFIQEWQQVDYLHNKQISMMNANLPITGVASGVTTQGYLLLKMADGMIRMISSGDVNTIR